MNKATYITKLKVNGIKGIQKQITLDFSNAIRSNRFDPSLSNIKGVYGPNGAGKSAIIHAMEIYKNLNLRPNYLIDSTSREYLFHLINNKTNQLSIEVEFVVYNPQDSRIIFHGSHSFLISKHSDGSIRNDQELYRSFRVVGIADTFTATLFHSQNGSLVEIYHNPFSDLDLRVNYEDKTLVDIMFAKMRKSKDDTTPTSVFFNYLFYLVLLNVKLETITDADDKHENYIFNYLRINESAFPRLDPSTSIISLSDHTDVVKATELTNYRNEAKLLENFIKLFKYTLLSIRIEEKINGDMVHIDKFFVYDGYEVHIEFESAGIKKLCHVFEKFRRIMDKRGILFIDELDSKINDVYLIKLIEFFSEFLKGQLVFTAHNVGPMEMLKSRKHSIDFISSDGLVSSWAKSGNYSITKLYRAGMIKNLPFNVQHFDFLSIFGDGESNE